MNDERLIVSLEARISEFEKRMKKAEGTGTGSYKRLERGSRSATRNMERDMGRATRSINKSLATATTRIGAFSKAFVGGLVGGAVTVGLSQLTDGLARTVRGIAQISDEAKRAGLALDAFQEWKFVAEQNRIGIDALVDSIKELNLRADEFVVTGKGPAAEAFQRLGFSAEQLRRELEDPSELMLEIIDRLQDLDRAAQIRISDEVFGGTGGEQFVQLLSQGRAEIVQTIEEGRRLGAVLDEEAIRKAEDLDRRWQKLTTRVTNFGKQLAVALADAPFDAFSTQVDELFSNDDLARGVLGDEVFDALREAGRLTEDQTDNVALLSQQYTALGETADRAASAVERSVQLLRSWGYDEAAAELKRTADGMRALVGEFQNGEVSGEAFAEKLEELRSTADEAYSQIEEIDRVEFSGAIASVAGLGRALSGLIGLAEQAKESLPGNSVAPTGGRGDGGAEVAARGAYRAQQEAADAFANSEARRNAQSREQLALQREIEAVMSRAADAGTKITEDQAKDMAEASLAAERRRLERPAPVAVGGGRGVGGGRESALRREIAAIKEKTEVLRLESATFIDAAGSREEYAFAIERAKAKTELLAAAQRDGVVVTDDLERSIDTLASGYAAAEMSVDAMRDRLDEARDAQREFQSIAKDAFLDLTSGAISFEDALGRIGERLVSLATDRALDELVSKIFSLGTGLGGGGFGGVIGGILGGLFSFDGGGYTGSGSRTGGVDGRGGFPAILHPNETVVDHTRASKPASTNVQVHIHNAPAGPPPQVRTGPGRVDIFLEEAVGRAVSSGGLDAPMRQRFGLRAQGQL